MMITLAVYFMCSIIVCVVVRRPVSSCSTSTNVAGPVILSGPKSAGSRVRHPPSQRTHASIDVLVESTSKRTYSSQQSALLYRFVTVGFLLGRVGDSYDQ